MSSPLYRIVYWPGLPGRAEPIRLALEYARLAYEDVAKGEPDQAVEEVMKACDASFDCPAGNIPPFAVPLLEIPSEKTFLSQLPNIMFYLGPCTGLAPKDELGRLRVNQVFLTLCDWQNEAHDVHHPVAVGDYYEDQKPEAFRRSIDFRSNRLPKFLSYLDRLAAKGDGHLVGNRLTYADLMVHHVLRGVKFAFPNASSRLLPDYPALHNVYDEVDKLPALKDYFSSNRREPFKDGLFRHYPELDVEADLEN